MVSFVPGTCDLSLCGTDTLTDTLRTLHNDEEHFPNPRAFEPQRYKDDTQSAFAAAHAADFKHRDHFTFGAGRRLCQGTRLFLPFSSQTFRLPVIRTNLYLKVCT